MAVAAKIRSKSKKLIQHNGETYYDNPDRKKYVSTVVRRTLHASVVTMNILTFGWFSYRCFIVNTTAPDLMATEFVSHGLVYLPYFFSLWMSALQHTYFSMYSVIDTLEILSEKWKNVHRIIDRIHTIASYLLFTLVFPVSLMIMILFWGLYHWNRTLIYPSVIDDWVSQWPNHVMHTFPVPLSVLYMLMSNRKEPPKLATLSGLIVFLGIYSSIFVAVKITSGKYVYLCLEKMPPIGVPVCLSFAVISPILFHSLGYKINDFFKNLKKTHPFLDYLSC